MSSRSVLDRWLASGRSSTGPPRGPGLSVMTPWNSSSRRASRSVPRPISYVSSMVRSGGSDAPGWRLSLEMSPAIRWATSMAVLVGRPLAVAMAATPPPPGDKQRHSSSLVPALLLWGAIRTHHWHQLRLAHPVRAAHPVGLPPLAAPLHAFDSNDR